MEREEIEQLALYKELAILEKQRADKLAKELEEKQTMLDEWISQCAEHERNRQVLESKIEELQEDLSNKQNGAPWMGDEAKIFTKEDARILLNNFQEYANETQIDPPYGFSTLVNNWIDSYIALNINHDGVPKGKYNDLIDEQEDDDDDDFESDPDPTCSACGYNHDNHMKGCPEDDSPFALLIRRGFD